MAADFPLLPDVTKESLAKLLASADDGNLARCIRRLVESLDDPDGVISAFQSYASDAPIKLDNPPPPD